MMPFSVVSYIDGRIWRARIKKEDEDDGDVWDEKGNENPEEKMIC